MSGSLVLAERGYLAGRPGLSVARAFSALVGQLRIALWLWLVAATAVLLLYPKSPSLNYAPVGPTINVFDNWPLFAALYYLWIASLAVLVFSLGAHRRNYWEGWALAAIFVLVFRGIWDIPFPERWSDGLLNATTAKFIGAYGELPLGRNLVYLDFPGLHLLTTSLWQMTGLELLDSVALVMVVLDLLAASLFYLVSLRLLGDVRLATFAALLMMQGNMVFAKFFFYPGYLGLLFVALLSLLLLRGGEAIIEGGQRRFIAILLLGAATITHFISSLMFLFLIIGIYLARQLARGTRPALLWSTPLLFVALPLTWEVYWALHTFGNLARFFPDLADNFSLDQFLTYAFGVGGANLGPQVPLWASLTRLLWMALLLGIGSIVGLAGLLGQNKLPSEQAKATGALLGVALLSVIATLVSSGGFEYYRFLMYAPLFTAPLLLAFISGQKALVRGGSFLALGLLFVGMSVPTFFAHAGTVAAEIFYPPEYASGRFLHRLYGQGEGLQMFTINGNA